MLPMYQRIGTAAYKKDLTNTLALCQALGNPQTRFKSIHIAGTNGKGSSSHMLAAILSENGYRTGLYSSPHLKNFGERIKIDGTQISEEEIINFVESNKKLIEDIQPSFFELTVAMAFNYFAMRKVDFAVIEVGLGGRLDSTNVILPEVSLITNISFDHQDLLGNTLGKIAFEKAGIIKNRTPIVIGEQNREVRDVFVNQAAKMNAPISFSYNNFQIEDPFLSANGLQFNIRIIKENTLHPGSFENPGLYQLKNLPGVLSVVDILKDKGNDFDGQKIFKALARYQSITGLKGRWQKLCDHPLIIADMAHNVGGIKEILDQLLKMECNILYFILGAVKDKDVNKILPLFPVEANYYFCEPKVPRAMEARLLQRHASLLGIEGEVIPDVNNAIDVAKTRAGKDDIIFVGGSTFVVSEIRDL